MRSVPHGVWETTGCAKQCCAPLTDVGNRLAFNRAIAERLASASVAQALGRMCIDLDRFKPVNDLYGHPIGDTVLIG